MTASELVAELQKLIALHGDLNVVDTSNYEVIACEFSEDDDHEPAIVLDFG